MKFIIPLIALILALSSDFSHSAELMINAGKTFNYMNITSQTETPTYKGGGFFGEVEYLIPASQKYAFSLYGIYHQSKLENTANDSKIQESLSNSYMGIGLKVYVGNLFLVASMGKYQFEDTVTGDIEKKIHTKESAREFGVGYRLRVTSSVGLVVSAHALQTSLDPENGSGFYKSYDAWEYRGSIGLSITLPSIAPGTAR